MVTRGSPKPLLRVRVLLPLPYSRFREKPAVLPYSEVFALKKVLSFLFALICCFTTISLAESFDFSAMTTDELLAMNKQIIAELQLRFNSFAATLYSGQYIVGTDIRSGSYLLSNANTDSFMLIAMFPTYEAFEDYLGWKSQNQLEESSNRFTYLFPGEEVSISLMDSEVLFVEDGNCQIVSIEVPYAP